MISVLILTKNEEQDLPGCLESVSWCNDVHVFDSFSDDKTIEIAKKYGARVTQKGFDNWADHQNWGLKNIPFVHSWVLYLDADERVSDSLKTSLFNFKDDPELVAFSIQRRDFAWNGKWLKHAQISPFYMRLFRPNKMRYSRLVNPVSLPQGPTGKLEGFIDHFPFSKGISFWINRHINYAKLEAQCRSIDLDNKTTFSLHSAFFHSDFSIRRYHQKGLFYKLPGRPIFKWFYMVMWRSAYLDGLTGITYANLQTLYEYFIVLNMRELNSKIKSSK